MKNPDRANATGVFPVPFTDTLASNVDATKAPLHATLIGRRYYWCRKSNSAQPLEHLRQEADQC